MKWLKRLFASSSADDSGLYYYVKGMKCGAITRLRIDRRNDLSRIDDDDDGADNASYFVRKVVVDSVCYGQVEVTVRFDHAYREVAHDAQGGVFVTEADWRAYLAHQQQQQP
jgi:hypothetical protein